MARRCPRCGRVVPHARKWALPQPAARGHWPRTGPGQRHRRSQWRSRTASYSSWLALPFTESDGGAPAVGGDDRAGDVTGLWGGEEGEDLGDLAGLGSTGEQGHGTEGLDPFGRGAGGQHWPAAMALTRTPEGLNSAAQARVIAASVALVAP